MEIVWWSLLLVYLYQEIIYIKCTQDDKYLVLWHCGNHTLLIKRRDQRKQTQRAKEMRQFKGKYLWL